MITQVEPPLEGERCRFNEGLSRPGDINERTDRLKDSTKYLWVHLVLAVFYTLSGQELPEGIEK